MNSATAAAAVQMATDGVRCAPMRRRYVENGRPPSRPKANVRRETDVSVARPHRYIAAARPV